jgi:hypothetical protein
MSQANAYRMIQLYAAAAGVATKISCHSWGVRGITAYLKNGGLLEHAQQMAVHASAWRLLRPPDKERHHEGYPRAAWRRRLL